jgi:hypothetical protein
MLNFKTGCTWIFSRWNVQWRCILVIPTSSHNVLKKTLQHINSLLNQTTVRKFNKFIFGWSRIDRFTSQLYYQHWSLYLKINHQINLPLYKSSKFSKIWSISKLVLLIDTIECTFVTENHHPINNSMYTWHLKRYIANVAFILQF